MCIARNKACKYVSGLGQVQTSFFKSGSRVFGRKRYFFYFFFFVARVKIKELSICFDNCIALKVKNMKFSATIYCLPLLGSYQKTWKVTEELIFSSFTFSFFMIEYQKSEMVCHKINFFPRHNLNCLLSTIWVLSFTTMMLRIVRIKHASHTQKTVQPLSFGPLSFIQLFKVADSCGFRSVRMPNLFHPSHIQTNTPHC